MTAINQESLDIIFREANDIYQQTVLESPRVADEITTDIPCTTRQVNFAFLDRVPVMRKWRGKPCHQ